MQSIISQIRDTRLNHGLTQMELSKLSGVSLPAIQKIESGNGNPSLETLLSISKHLHLNLQLISSAQLDWNELVHYGVPLGIIAVSHSKKRASPSPQKLAELLRLFSQELFTAPKNEEASRKTEALQALIFALQTHYPNWFKKNCKSKFIQSLAPKKITGRLIKLRRIALERLSRYL